MRGAYRAPPSRRLVCANATKRERRRRNSCFAPAFSSSTLTSRGLFYTCVVSGRIGPALISLPKLTASPGTTQPPKKLSRVDVNDFFFVIVFHCVHPSAISESSHPLATSTVSGSLAALIKASSLQRNALETGSDAPIVVLLVCLCRNQTAPATLAILDVRNDKVCSSHAVPPVGVHASISTSRA